MTVMAKEDKGSTVEVSAKRKWAKRIGNFLLMGGWLLIAFLVIGIFILISVLTK